MDEATLKEVALYIEHAEETLEVARLDLDNDFYAAAINRAYYAIFYAANALLATKKLTRSKHSGTLAAFRQHFIKPGLLPQELSEIYGQVMEDRHEGDYEILSAVSREDAEIDVRQARHFVDTVKAWLRKKNWLR
ncbi:MAG: HEPN domain-containing protein [Anaerolineae bacterium]|nr:MAG: HEPN domain-containing protein [Anaerolineae bacterium]